MKKRIFAVLLAALFCLTAAAPAAFAALMGDLDADGGLSAADARLALRAAVGLDELDEKQTKLADADGDDNITAADARLILRAAVGLEELGELPDPGEEEEDFDYDAIPDEAESETGIYELAYVTDWGELKDDGLNETAWNGVKRYAAENGKTYKYYLPGGEATDEDLFNALEAAAANGAKVISAAGFFFDVALTRAALAHPDVQYIFLDGWALENEAGERLENVLAVTFKEAEAGFLAGYAAVMEGYTSLGFSGAGGGENDGVNRYGFGFLQGANAAAKEKNETVSLRISYRYGETFSPSDELQALMLSWYRDEGVQAIMSCGGGMVDSAAKAAEQVGGKVIGVDADLALEYGDLVLTSAFKDLCGAVRTAMDLYYSGRIADYTNREYHVGIAEGGVALPAATWSMTQYTPEMHAAMIERFVNGDYDFTDDLAKMEDAAYRTNLNVTVD